MGSSEDRSEVRSELTAMCSDLGERLGIGRAGPDGWDPRKRHMASLIARLGPCGCRFGTRFRATPSVRRAFGRRCREARPADARKSCPQIPPDVRPAQTPEPLVRFCPHLAMCVAGGPPLCADSASADGSGLGARHRSRGERGAPPCDRPRRHDAPGQGALGARRLPHDRRRRQGSGRVGGRRGVLLSCAARLSTHTHSQGRSRQMSRECRCREVVRGGFGSCLLHCWRACQVQ